MSRTIFVALCAVAILAMAPFVVAGEDNVPPNPVTDAHRELTIGMTPAEWQPIVENHLGWTKPEKSEYFAEGSTERRVMWTWDAQTKGGPNEPQWHFHLDVVFVEDVIRSTMYYAECTRGAHEEAKPADQEPTVPENPCRKIFDELALGMAKDEFLKLAEMYGVKDGLYTIDSGEERWGNTWFKYHREDPVPPPPDAWQWQIMLWVKFADGRVATAEYIPLTHPRTEEKK